VVALNLFLYVFKFKFKFKFNKLNNKIRFNSSMVILIFKDLVIPDIFGIRSSALDESRHYFHLHQFLSCDQ
jgi:hypothetical protein